MNDLRALYHPVQPSVSLSHAFVQYREIQPAIWLRPYICCYWMLSAAEPLTKPFEYRVVADGCIDLFFELDQQCSSYVMGCSNSFTSFALNGQFRYAGVRFLPSMFTALYGIPAGTLSNAVFRLTDVLPSFAAYIRQHCEDHLPLLQFARLADDFFLHHLKTHPLKQDSRLLNVMHQIYQKEGNVQLKSDLEVFMSARQLRRLFDEYIGANPKTFSKIIRFQQLIRKTPDRKTLKKEKLYFDMGYTDQSHFIREFRQMYGTTPLQALEE